MAHGNYVHRAAFGAVAIVAWYSISWQTHETLDRPVPSIIFAFLLCAVVFRLAERVLPRDFGNSRSPQSSPAILEDAEEYDSKEDTAGRLSQPPPLEPRSRHRVFLLVVGCIVLRVETLRRISQHIECTANNLEVVLLPMLIAIYEYVAVENNHDWRDENDMMWADNLLLDIYLTFTPFRARFILPTFWLCFGIFLISVNQLPTTYVCPAASSPAYSVVGSQGTGVVLDFIIILGTWRLFSNSNDEKRKLGTFAAIGLYSAALISSLSIPYLLYSSLGSIRMPSLALLSIWPTVKDGTALAIALICFLYFISEIRPLVLAMVFTFAWVYPSSIQEARLSFSPFPPQSKGAQVLGLLLLLIGFTTFMNISTNTERSTASRNFAKHVSIWLYVLLTISFLIAEVTYLLKPGVAGFHPINILMYNARIDGDRWLVHASSSISLETAVAEYRSRYRGQAPPPNFDKWYEFAKERGCPIIDNYDQIDRDLLPFWAVPPAVIRQRSPVQLPGNDIIAIRILDGHVDVSPAVSTRSKWKPEETVKLIEEFAQWLPDMYIAFNLRDVPRVAVPWKQVEKLKQKALTMDLTSEARKVHGYTEGSELTLKWPSVDYNSATSERYEEDFRTMQRTRSSGVSLFPSVFQRREASTCPPGSPTRQSRAWHAQGFCASCAYPHSLGQFLQNWTTAGDLCHQPDMANLHGFLMSPGTMPESGISPDELVPLFSRTKISGYNDILFPGPWDYAIPEDSIPNDKIFSELSNTLLCRAELEHGSPNPAWRGHTPQRLAHLANNVNSTRFVPMLLPANEPDKFVYENVPSRELAGLLDLDVALIECPGCKHKEYIDQVREVGVKPDMGEEDMFQYRYLFIPGGPGESWKLINCLRSNSVPFRSSIFRYWYDDRLMPWLHYVPIDGRLQAVHSTLAYFTGLKGKINGRDIDMPQKFSEAKFIADQGRKWAEKALRKEDAAAYLFRLLLEYGRVVDDRRNEIGFQLEA